MNTDKPLTYLIPLNFHQKLQFFIFTSRGIIEGIIAALLSAGAVLLFLSFLVFWVRLGLVFIVGGTIFFFVARGFYGEPFSKFVVTYFSHKKYYQVYELRRLAPDEKKK